MDLSEFLLETQIEVRAQMSDGSPFAEMVFSEVVMQHMAGLHPSQKITQRMQLLQRQRKILQQ